MGYPAMGYPAMGFQTAQAYDPLTAQITMAPSTLHAPVPVSANEEEKNPSPQLPSSSLPEASPENVPESEIVVQRAPPIPELPLHILSPSSGGPPPAAPPPSFRPPIFDSATPPPIPVPNEA